MIFWFIPVNPSGIIREALRGQRILSDPDKLLRNSAGSIVRIWPHFRRLSFTGIYFLGVNCLFLFYFFLTFRGLFAHDQSIVADLWPIKCGQFRAKSEPVYCSHFRKGGNPFEMNFPLPFQHRDDECKSKGGAGDFHPKPIIITPGSMVWFGGPFRKMARELF